MSNPSPEERAIKATKELREAIQEAHGVLQEAHGVQKDLRSLLKELRGIIKSEVSDLIEQRTLHELERLQKSVTNQIDESTRAVYRRFDRITAILTGEDDKGPTLDELARVRQAIKIEHERRTRGAEQHC